MNIEQLRNKLEELNSESQSLRQKATEEGRDLTVEEEARLTECLAEFDRVQARIDQLTKLDEQTAKLSQPQGRKTQPSAPATLSGDGEGTVTLSHRDRLPAQPRSALDRNWGFSQLGEFALHVRRASIKGGHQSAKLETSERLAATIYGSEGSGADGGFAVPPDFRTAIMEAVLGEESLISRCDTVTTSGNTFTCPVDMTTPWQTSGGIQTYWGAEAGTKTQSKPQLQDRTTKLNKLYALVPMTDELMDDAPALDSYLRKKAPAKISFAADLAIVNGTGVGQPLGFLRSAALVSVGKESGQQADTLIATNVIKMYSAMYAPSRSRAVWLINQDIEPKLMKLSIAGTDETGNTVSGWGGLVYTPANGLAGAPYGTLFGRPVIPHQAMETLGDLGDIAFVDLTQYLLLLKSGANPRVDVSMHLWFDQDVTAYRFVLRIGGIPWWDAPIDARDGTADYSPFVAMAERA